jgi:hypothetical protein
LERAPLKGLIDSEQVGWQFFYLQTMVLAHITDIDNDTPNFGQFLHYQFPLFLALLDLLIYYNEHGRRLKSEGVLTSHNLRAWRMRPAAGEI